MNIFALDSAIIVAYLLVVVVIAVVTSLFGNALPMAQGDETLMPTRKQDRVYWLGAVGLLLVYCAVYWYFF